MDKFELYNLKDDVKETTNLAAKEPQRVEQMHRTMARLVAEMAKDATVWKGGRKKSPVEKDKTGLAVPPTTPGANDFAIVQGGESRQDR